MKRNALHVMTAILLAAFTLTSCKAPKEVQYMQDIVPGTVSQASSPMGLLIEPDDLLSIVVTTKDPELGTLFNLQPGTITSDMTGMGSTSNSAFQKRDYGYRVDAQGNIVFPLLGTLHVEGLTRTQLEALIKSRILKEGLLKDFTVSVSFLNAQITILGDVSSPHNYEFKDDKYTILQALADAGDLNITGKRNITVIREKKGKREVYEVDLKSKDLFDSPVYYLQQNDIIYVTPNSQKAAQSDNNANQWRQISTWMGLVGFAGSVISLIAVITK